MASDQTNLNALKKEILELLPSEGMIQDIVPKVRIARIDNPTLCQHRIYSPMLAVVLQGAKRSIIGGTKANYGPGQCAVISADLPANYHIECGQSNLPFLSISVALDRKIVTDLINEFPEFIKDSNYEENAVEIQDVSDEIVEILQKMLKLRNSGTDLSFYQPLYLRELHYLLLKGSHKRSLSVFLTNQGNNSRVASAIAWLRQHFKEPFDIETLAKKSSMAVSTFHKNFKSVTTLSPIQFQKTLRLQEAKRLMLSENHSVEMASLEVGYESASQFSREYKRLFGLSPRDDIRKSKLDLAS